jgi:hypothetical protein
MQLFNLNWPPHATTGLLTMIQARYTRTLGVRFSALLTEGDTERLELARA